MPDLFDKHTGDEMLHRLENVQLHNERKWGKMNVAQMLAHLHYVLQLATGDKTEKPTFMMKLMGPMIKKVVFSEKPFKQGLPTGPNFIVADERIFETEKANLITTYKNLLQQELQVPMEDDIRFSES